MDISGFPCGEQAHQTRKLNFPPVTPGDFCRSYDFSGFFNWFSGWRIILESEQMKGGVI